jgi:hypothetical protein
MHSDINGGERNVAKCALSYVMYIIDKETQRKIKAGERIKDE